MLKPRSCATTTALPLISIIIVNYNGIKFLKNCLTSLSKIYYPNNNYEVIIADNNSTDGSQLFLKTNFPWVKLLQLNKNYGYTGGNNKGAKIANGEILAFLNNDTTVDKNWLYNMVKIMLSQNIDLCGSKIFYMNYPEEVQYSGGYLHLIGGSFTYPFPDKSFHYVGSVIGASFCIKKEVFFKIGLFDEEFFLESDETDLCLRAWIYGYSVGYVPSSIIYHYSGGTSSIKNTKVERNYEGRLVSPVSIYYGNRNSLLMIIKNFEINNLLLGLIFSYLYMSFQLIILLRKRSTSIISLLKAMCWPLLNIKICIVKRRIIQQKRKVSDNELIKRKLLLTIPDTIRLNLKIIKR